MKTIILWAFYALFSLQIGFAQPYSFTVHSGTYQNLIASQSCNNGLTWDDPNFTIPLGFNFNYFGHVIDTVILGYGYGGTLITSLNSTGIASFLSPFGSDLMDRGFNFSQGPGQSSSLSNISYQTIGTSGSRIFKLEWNNVGFYSDIQLNGANAKDFVNFQLWLYEGSDQIEIHFGPATVSSPLLSYDGFSGPDILLIPNMNLNNFSFGANYYSLDGLPLSPTLLTKAPTAFPSYLVGTVPNGVVYRFLPLVSSKGENDLNDKAISIYPNPTSTFFRVSNLDLRPETEAEIIDINGKVVIDRVDLSEAVDITSLNSGIYFLRLSDKNKVKILRLVIEP